MVILAHFQPWVKTYSRLLHGSMGETRVFVVSLPRVSDCPSCGLGGACIKWGSYTRWVAWVETAFQIRVQRYRCKGCAVTCSALPSFCVPGFTYGTPVIGAALERYLVGSCSYDGVVQAIHQRWDRHTLVSASVRRWVAAFRRRADRILKEATGAIAKLRPNHPLLTKKGVEAGNRRRVGAASLRALEALRRTSEGVTLGRGFRERRFEFYNLWLFRHQHQALVG
jgi:hypothetical protein